MIQGFYSIKLSSFWPLALWFDDMRSIRLTYSMLNREEGDYFCERALPGHTSVYICRLNSSRNLFYVSFHLLQYPHYFQGGERSLGPVSLALSVYANLGGLGYPFFARIAIPPSLFRSINGFQCFLSSPLRRQHLSWFTWVSPRYA